MACKRRVAQQIVQPVVDAQVHAFLSRYDRLLRRAIIANPEPSRQHPRTTRCHRVTSLYCFDCATSTVRHAKFSQQAIVIASNSDADDRVRGVLESDFHEGRVTITVPVRLAPRGGPGPRELKGRVVYQICDWDQCLNGEVPFQLRLRVIDGVSAAKPATR